MEIRRRILAVASAALVTASVVVGGPLAGAAVAPSGLDQGTPARVHTGTVTGTYELYANGDDLGPLVLNSNFTFTVTQIGDTGVWIATGKSFAMSITASTRGDGGCTFSGTLEPDGINASRPKKEGYYTCSGSTALRWYATRPTSHS